MLRLKLALITAISVLCLASNSDAQVRYQQTSTTGLSVNTATVPFALDDITFAPGSTAVLQQLSALTFGLGVLPGTTAQTATVFFDFYNTVNAASLGAVNTDYLGGFVGTITITANTGTGTAARAFTFSNLASLSTPILFNDDNIGVVLRVANAAGDTYSTVAYPLTSNPGAPTIGASATGIYRDANNDGTFQSSEFNAAQGNLYLSISTVAVPEPATISMFAFGVLPLLAIAHRKARNRRRA